LQGFIPLSFNVSLEPVGIVTSVGQQPLWLWQTAQHGNCRDVIADLACGYEEPDRTTFRICDGVQLVLLTDCVNPLPGSVCGWR
jgi:hypothetical protein